MGNTSSSGLLSFQGAPAPGSPEGKQNAMKALANTQLAVSDKAKQDLDMLNSIVTGFSKNNTELILNTIDKYNEVYGKGDPSKQVVLNDKIIRSVKTFHNNLIKSIDGQEMQYMTAEQRANKIDNIADFKQASKTLGLIKNYVSKDIDALKESIVKEDIIAHNEDVKKTVNAIFNSFSDLKARDAFFQYKYIQSYMFLAIFVQHVYQSMQNFVKEIIAINELKDQYRQESYRKIFNKILEAYQRDTNEMPELENIDALNQFFADLGTDMQKKQDDVKKAFEAAQKNSMEGILRFVLENETSLTNTLMNVVKEMEAKKPAAAAPAPMTQLQPQPMQPPPAQQQAWSAQGGRSSAQKGGFVRGGSTFPQAFYEL